MHNKNPIKFLVQTPDSSKIPTVLLEVREEEDDEKTQDGILSQGFPCILVQRFRVLDQATQDSTEKLNDCATFCKASNEKQQQGAMQCTEVVQNALYTGWKCTWNGKDPFFPKKRRARW